MHIFENVALFAFRNRGVMEHNGLWSERTQNQRGGDWEIASH